MRSIFIGLSILFFTLSSVVFYKALQIPAQVSTINIPITDIPLTNKSVADAPPSSQGIPQNQAAQSSETIDNLAQSQQGTEKSTVIVPETATVQPEEKSAPTTPVPTPTPTPEQPIEKTHQAPTVEYHSRILTVFDGKAFRSGQDVVREAAASKIEKLISEISVFPNSHILIEGHTDNIPTGNLRRNNMNLSVRRANAIAKILISRGIAPERISVVGYGDTRPIDTNRTEEGRARNRRVEVKLMLKEGEN